MIAPLAAALLAAPLLAVAPHPIAVLPAPVSPQINSVFPAGGQRGTTVTVTVRGERLDDAEGLLGAPPGLQLQGIGERKADRCELTLAIDADCPLGSHVLRLRTRTGLSNPVLFHVGALPTLREQSGVDGPQLLPLDCTVDGELRGDEIDRFAIDLAAGVRVNVEVEAMRLGFTAADTALVVVGPDAAVIASADDSALGRRDPWLSFTAAAAGRHELRLQAAVPGENRSSGYRLHVGTFPRPHGALPCGGRPGETLQVRLLGDRDDTLLQVHLPDDGREVLAWLPELPTGTAPTPIWLRVGGPPNREPVNDEQGRQHFEVPGAVHGIVATPGAGVRFRFAANKGQELEFRVVARELRSPLDPTLVLRAANGRFLAFNDDGTSPDSTLRYTPTEDGELEVEVRDLLRSGSPAHFFRLEVAPRARPLRTTLVVARDQDPTLVVPRGSCAAGVLQLTNADAATTLQLDGLPPGVTAWFGPRIDGGNQVPVLLSAEGDAPLGGALSQLVRAGADGAGADAGLLQALTLLNGRNNTPLLQTIQQRMPIAVVDPAPFIVDVAVAPVPIVRGAPLQLPLRIERRGDFRGRLRVRAVWTPPGISAGQVNIGESQAEAVLALEADPNAKLGHFPIVLAAGTRLGNGRFEQAMPWVPIAVAAPMVRATLGKARAEPGQTTQFVVDLAVDESPPGPYRATLTSLPRGASAEPVQVEPGATTVVFTIAVGADTPPGRHRNVQVELRIPGPGGELLHRFGGGELRVDAKAGAR